MFKLNSHINYSRKGLRNTFKSWMRRPKQAGPLTSADVAGMPSLMYPHTSIEAQIRMLADLAFMLQVCVVLLSCGRLHGAPLC